MNFEMMLLLVDLSLLYLAGLIYLPKIFLIPPLAVASAIFIGIAAVIYAVHVPILVWVKIPYLGWPAKKFLGLETALVAMLIGIFIYENIAKEIQKEMDLED